MNYASNYINGEMREVLLWFYDCLECEWFGDQERSPDKLKFFDICPECNSNSVKLESDFFQV